MLAIFSFSHARETADACARACTILLENANGVVSEETTFRHRSRSVQSRVNWF